MRRGATSTNSGTPELANATALSHNRVAKVNFGIKTSANANSLRDASTNYRLVLELNGTLSIVSV